MIRGTPILGNLHIPLDLGLLGCSQELHWMFHQFMANLGDPAESEGKRLSLLNDPSIVAPIEVSQKFSQIEVS